MADVKLNASEIMQDLTVTIRMPRAFGIRMWIVGRLIKLASIISAVNISVSIDDARPSNSASAQG